MSLLKNSTRSRVGSTRSIASDRLALLGTYMVSFGVIRGAGLFVLSSLSPKSRGRKVELSLPDSGGTLTLRLGTSDLFVFGDIFLRHEYGWDLSPSPRVIVDAGAYTGLSTCYFANRFPDATIIAIEPDEENYELLKLNTARYENVYTTRAALWSESGFVSLTDPGYGAWGLQLLESANANTVGAVNSSAARAEQVQALTVADILREYHLDKIDLLKVDVEGSEKEIFANAGPWIGSVDAICIELHDRFKAGCSRSFFRAVDDFPVELRRGEDVLVMRDRSRVSPELESAHA